MCDEQKELPVPSSPYIPGAPAPRVPDLREPVQPRPPLSPEEDQRQPEVRTVAGAEPATDSHGRAQQGEFLTTATGTHLYETDHSLTVGERGPTLLQDHHLWEQITHFDHERIPERVVHACGAAAHGNSVANGSDESICKAALFAKGTQNPHSLASRRYWAHAAQPILCATLAGSRPSFTPRKVYSTW